jgi:hypothetical protein
MSLPVLFDALHHLRAGQSDFVCNRIGTKRRRGRWRKLGRRASLQVVQNTIYDMWIYNTLISPIFKYLRFNYESDVEAAVYGGLVPDVC